MQDVKFQFSWASGASAAKTQPISHNGFLKQFYTIINDNTGNRTLTVEILDQDSVSVYSLAGIAENATTTTQLTTTTMAPVGEKYFVKVTPSGDPGASGMTVTLKMFLATNLF